MQFCCQNTLSLVRARALRIGTCAHARVRAPACLPVRPRLIENICSVWVGLERLRHHARTDGIATLKMLTIGLETLMLTERKQRKRRKELGHGRS